MGLIALAVILFCWYTGVADIIISIFSGKDDK